MVIDETNVAITSAEKALIVKYPKESYVAYIQKRKAEKRTDLYFPKGTVDDESDKHLLLII